jgi:DNA-binding CsgD family transcriptional regulator/tetratricopeptide (TPR) repeat protein
VMTRAAQLPAAGRAVLEAASVMSEGAEPAVLIRVATGTGGLDACVAAGLLIQDGVVIRFRHELARQVTEAGLTPERRAALHSDVLAALLASGLGEPARCVHHAEAAGDVAQVLRFSRLAADRAIALGSHREATAQLERALRFTVGDQPETLIERGELLDQLSEQYLLRDRSGEAHRVHDEALGIWRAVGDPARLGACLRRRAEVLRYSDNGTGSIEAAQSAVELLRPLGEGPQLARALASLAQALMLAERSDQAVSVAEQAIEMAELFGQEQTRAHALATLGSARALAGEEDGLAQIAAGAAGSRAAGFDADSVRATSNLVSSQLLYDQVQGLRPIIEAEVDFAAERGMESHVQCMRVALATVYLRTGKWDEAGEIAQAVMRFGTAAAQRIEPLILIGTLRARRGDPAPEVPLDEALRSALRIGEPQLIYPAHRALAELAWLTGQSDSAARHAATARAALAHAPRHPLQSEAAYWCFRAGIPGPELLSPQHPFALQAAGRPAEAARLWNAMGFPYHEADALADSLDEADQRRAWTLFESLGVGSRAAGIARRLRAVGAKDLPRRPHAASRANPAGLTDRQLEIAGLIAAHLTNQEIAERLYLSPRTVDHHVSAILGKLEVGNRRHAAQRCQDLGIPAG